MDALADTLANGGGTYRIGYLSRDRVTLANGYVVGIAQGTSAIVQIDAPTALLDGVMVAIEHAYGSLVGTWIDWTTHTIHVDPVQWVADREDAIRLGRQNAQLAIWDVKNAKEITL